ncbi:MAG: phage portal protein [Candidatus Heimdallarchaeaceae archaeon]
MGILDLFKKEKSVPPVATITEESRGGIPKAYIPKFLYKPPFGYPRYVDLVTIRRLAAMPYVEMCISTIVDNVCAVPWDIVPKEGKEDSPTLEEHKKQVMDFYKNPNTNKESFEEIRRKYIRDILEVDAGVLNKVFNQKGEMVEIVARDGATFTKNPDIYGMFTDREDLILDAAILPPNKESSAMSIEPGFISAADAREKAAYFQYGWLSGARPVPFGRREIIWFERNPRTDNIYGRSPIQNLADTIQTLIYAIEHNLEYFNDNSIPKGVLGLEGSDSDEIIAFKEQWMEQQRKKDSAGNWKKVFHQLPIVGKTPTFTRFQLTNAEMELLEGQKWWSKMVWACFGVTSVELGYTEDAKGLANQIVQSNVFKKRSINPILRLEEYKHNQEIISEFEFDDVEFKFLMFDVDEEIKKAQLYQQQLSGGWKSINEIRVEEGLDEVEWGDKQTPEEQHQQEMDKLAQSGMFGGSMQEEENNQKKKVKKEKEILQSKKEEKDIETKPFGGYTNFDECVSKNRDKKDPKAYCAEIMRRTEGKAWESNPLILGPNEAMDEDRLKKSIIYLLKQNEAKIKALVEREMGSNTLQEIKALDDLAKAIKSILTFDGIKSISDAIIKNTFMEGHDSAEKQLNKNLMVNNEAMVFIQDYTFNNIKGMTDEIMQDLRQELERGIIEGEGITKIKARIGKVFDVGENRAEMIARTETNRAEGQGKLQAFKSSGEKLMKKWDTHFDDRTSAVCKRLHGQVVGINENFKDKISGWEGPTHPAHVNCRSSVIYIEKEE